ncbi:MAG: acyl-CoA/acyl-ACP dehydrogenase [Deltaproteobacteria bacterium]|nr:acyl-CoA/acyl-ACP dehydrogenase [Deltaproteobacteria bacterium]
MFEFSDEHEELRRTVRAFLEKESDETRVRELMASERGFDPATWQRMAEELGLTSLIVPEAHDGAGFGMVELAIVMEEMGRVLLCSPFLSSAVLATSALVLAADEAAQAELLPRLACGELRATLAFSETPAPWELSAIEMRAAAAAEGFTLDGEKTFVLDGLSAELILVVARVGEETTLFRVEADAPGLTREALPPFDPTRKLARLSFDGTPAQRIASGDASEGIERALERGVAALAAEQVGGAQRCLDMAIEYAKTRIQFGRPIGSYQAIKHQCADLLVDVELAKSAAYNAAYNADFAAEESDESAGIAAAMAKSFCSEAYWRIAKRNLQIHGGMGFTWEHPAHLYLKRAKGSQLLLGAPGRHRARLAATVGIGRAAS